MCWSAAAHRTSHSFFTAVVQVAFLFWQRSRKRICLCTQTSPPLACGHSSLTVRSFWALFWWNLSCNPLPKSDLSGLGFGNRVQSGFSYARPHSSHTKVTNMFYCCRIESTSDCRVSCRVHLSSACRNSCTGSSIYYQRFNIKIFILELKLDIKSLWIDWCRIIHNKIIMSIIFDSSNEEGWGVSSSVAIRLRSNY